MADRNRKGQFLPGNRGKPKGATHRATRAVMALLEGESAELTRKAIERALEGDTTALRLCLERIAPPPKDSPVRFKLPSIESATDATRAAAAILKAVSQSKLTPSEGAHVMALVDSYRRALETSEIEQRIDALERAKAER